MLQLRLSADSLAATCFAISPLMQVGAVIHPRYPAALHHEYFTGREVRETLQERRLHLLSALRREIRGYAPGFMAGQSDSPGSDLEDELHRVATTPTHLVARQMDRVLRMSSPRDNPTSSTEPTVRTFLEQGEREFAQKVACELEQFWNDCLAPVWSSIAARAEADIDDRAHTIARTGLSGALNSLHPTIAYRDNTLSFGGSERGADVSHVDCGGRLRLFPSPLAPGWLVGVDPWHERGSILIYPTRRPSKPGSRGGPGGTAGQPWGNVIGHSRLGLLTLLDSPRTTTELAEQHHMSPSTVSYHLTRLHQAGLVTRTRAGNRVYYQRTTKAERLLDPPSSPAGATARRQDRPGRPGQRPVT
ncbi:transcriptional regulator [Streptomyces inhibens]|uniref:Transcriptional regulator n=1 Tax=Streptomyces inhibens TaxID=2293571 RepID=A0A371PR50_STRIH|nr:helix-turn-helix domain-containing protein [Streptomyces inhibens]REK84613.1 transcriptional regulator [Streptomyces inhibens]